MTRRDFVKVGAGAEEAAPWRGTAGYFEGSYFTGMKGSLRTPAVVRYPVAKILLDYQESMKREPLIPAGAPLDFVPKQKSP